MVTGVRSGMKGVEVREKRCQWEARGAPIKEAGIQYYPSEPECLSHGLAEHVAKAI